MHLFIKNVVNSFRLSNAIIFSLPTTIMIVEVKPDTNYPFERAVQTARSNG